LAIILAFSLFPLSTVSPSRQRPSRVARQIGYFLELAPVLVCSTFVGALVLAFLGWQWRALLPICIAWLGMNAVALMILRGAGSYALALPRVNERIARKVAVIGCDDHAWRVASLCQAVDSKHICFLGIFSDDAARAEGFSLSGSIEDLLQLSRDISLDDIIIAVPPHDHSADLVQDLRWRLRGVASEVYIMPYLARTDDVLPVEMFGPLSLMVVQRRPLTHGQALRKRMLDLLLGSILLLMLFPVLTVIAVAIKLDSPGPVLFRQPRLGFNDRSFTVLKFRSMYANTSDLMAARQTSRQDPRVTRIGKWLRKLSLDELPQLFNVIAGDMSLVGPRPHAPHTRAGGQLLKDVMAEYIVRHQVKPGITGWAQVNGSRGELVTTEDLRRRVSYDLEYIQKWSIWLDVKIIALTILREVFSKHAF
jgi:Undecaprenyl-phosphate glucose phosphotransferase